MPSEKIKPLRIFFFVKKMDLVFGPTTILGSHLIYCLLKKGRSIRAVKTQRTDEQKTKQILQYYTLDDKTLYDEIEWVSTDLLDYDQVNSAMEGIEVVYNCLGVILDKNLTKDDKLNYNLEAIKNISEAAIKQNISYFVHISSVDALGKENDVKEITEQTQRNPKEKYSFLSNCYFEIEKEVYKAFYSGLKGSILNTGFIIAPGNWQKDFSSLVNKVYNGNKFYIKTVTGFVGIDDVLKCIMSLTKQKPQAERYIVSSQNLSFKDVVIYIAKFLKVDCPKIHANKFILYIWHIVDVIKKVVFNKSNEFEFVSKDIIKNSNNFSLYCNKKSIGTLIFEYQPIEDSIEHVCEIFLRDNPNIK